MANTLSSIPAPRFRFYWWPALAVVLMAIQVAAAPTATRSVGLTAYRHIVYLFFSLGFLLATAIAALNALRSAQAIRLFWCFYALACGLWALNAWSCVFHVAIVGNVNPDDLLTGGPLFLHLVFLIAAVASGPQGKLSRNKPYRTALTFLPWLLFWALAYAFVRFPVPYMQRGAALFLRGQNLYAAESLLLLAVLGTAAMGARPPWKAIYGQLLGASILYALGALWVPIFIISGALPAGSYNLAPTAAAYWFVWVALQGRQRESQLAQAVRAENINPKYAGNVAMLTVIVLPLVGGELIRADGLYTTRAIRLLIVLLAILFLVLTTFVAKYFAKRKSSSDIGAAHDRLRMAMAYGKVVGWDWDVKTGRVAWLGDLRSMLGIPSNTYSAQIDDFYRYLHSDDRERVSEAVTKARLNHKPLEAEFRIVWQDGTIRWVAAGGRFCDTANGESARMLGMAVDITERKQAEEGLKKSEEKFSKAFRRSPLALSLMSAKDHRYLDINETFEKLSGWCRDEVIGRTPFDIGIWIDPDERLEFTKDVLAQSVIHDLEVRYRRKDGSERVGLGSAELIEIGNEPCVLSSIADITERKHVEESLTLANERLRLAMEAGKCVGWERDLATGRVLRFGDLESVLGTPSENESGQLQDFYQLLHPDDRQRILDTVAEAESGHNPYAAEFRILRPDGTIRWLAAKGKFHYAANGHVERSLGMVMDITEHRESEERLREYEKVVERAEEMIAVVDRQYRYVIANRAFLNQRHVTREQVVGRLVSEVRNYWGIDSVVKERLDVCLQGGVVKCEMRYVYPDLGERDLFVSYFPIVGPTGVDRVACIFQDITERKRAEHSLQKAQDELLEAQRVAQLGNWQLDLSSGALTWSKQLYRIHGLDPTLLPRPFRKDLPQLFTPESWSRLDAVINDTVKTGAIQELELEIVRPDGSTRWVATRGEAVCDGSGRVTLLRGTVQDITERKHIENRLHESQTRLEVVVASAMDAIIALDSEQRVVLFNAAAEKMFGCFANGAIGASIERFLPQRFRAEHGPHIGCFGEYGIKDRGLGTLGTLWGVRANGEEFPIEASISHVPADGRKLVTVIIRDVTERRRAEEALRESEERFRRVVEQIGDAIFVNNVAGRILLANNRFLSLFGFHRDELENLSLEDCVAPEYRPELRDRHDRLMRGEAVSTHFEYEGMRRDGSRMWLEADVVPVIDQAGKLVGTQSAIRDITERKRAEQALRESEERFRLVANTAPVMIWMSGPDRLCNYFNQPWLEFTGRPLEAELGNGWAEGVHSQDLNTCLDTYNQAFNQRESFKMQYRLRRHDGEYRWILDIGVPRVNPDGSFAGYIGSCIDITDRKLAEEALAGIGRRLIEAHEEERTWIARELHDDINQRIALLAIELEQFRQHLPESAMEYHDPIRKVRQRLSEISNDIQALSHRLHSSKLEYLGIAAAASSFCQELSEQQKVEIEFRHAEVPRSVPKEISLCLFRVLQEALQNAVKHSGARHFRVEIRGSSEEIKLTVCDRGRGFDPQNVMNRPGLGLISMRERLQWVNGEFSIKSQPGHGTTIYARVPLTSKQHRASMAG